METVWLLDIDGVVNALGNQVAREEAWDDWSSARVQGFLTTVSQSVARFVNQINRNTDCDVMWHSTWQDKSYLVARQFRIDGLSVAPAYDFETHRFSKEHWWKVRTVQELLEDGCAVVWTDDEIQRYAAVDSRVNRLLENPNLLAICPDDRVGLVKDELDQILAFIKKHEDGDLSSRLPSRITHVDEVAPRLTWAEDPSRIGTSGTTTTNAQTIRPWTARLQEIQVEAVQMRQYMENTRISVPAPLSWEELMNTEF